VTSRFRLAWLVGSLALAGCGEALNPGPLRYEETPALTQELADKTKPNLAGKPKLQEGVRKGLAKTFGENPQRIQVPAGSGFANGGIQLAGRFVPGKDPKASPKTILVADSNDPDAKPQRQAGGFALYRRHCLHCHGVSGAGDGPTAPFLYPLPRDYRPGRFKFTSTPNGAKPTRDDLRRTIRDGLHGTSMPAFETMMTPSEIEQVLEYVIFLSMRGETELALIDVGSIADENDPEAFSDEIVTGEVENVINKWTSAETQVFNPPVPRTPNTRQSVLRGRDLFLGHKSRKGNTVDCVGCHGVEAKGDGVSFVAQDVFNDVVFSGDPSGMGERIQQYRKEIRDMWNNSLDDWGNPLRPNNLNRGVYKGGRRPLDLYWRIAKGITGAKMPGHYPTLEADEIWDLVNFVLALPYEPELLHGAVPASAAPASKPNVAQR